MSAALALGALAVLSWAYQLLSLAAVRSLLRPSRVAAPGPRPLPPVSILVPVRGADFGALESFAALARQDYPRFELLFAAAEAGDPALAVVEELKRKAPRPAAIRTFVAPARGARNPKVELLAVLEREARYDILATCDSDVRLAPGALRAMVEELGSPGVGLVTSPYRPEAARSWPARLEALGIALGFLPSAVLAHRWLGLRFALGACNVLTRADLDRIGGFAALADLLADDHELGARVAASGKRVALSRELASTVIGACAWGELWQREVRWARTIRTRRPAEYSGIALTLSTPLALAALAASAGAAWAWAVLGVSALLRAGVGWCLASLLGDRELRRSLWLLPARDCLSAAVWVAGAAGRTVCWRGRRLTLDPRGRIVGEAERRSPYRTVDGLLRRWYGIFDLADDPCCLLRVRVRSADRDISLADGTRVRRGEPVAELHLWNEHIPEAQRSLAWGRKVGALARHSLGLLARALESDERLRGVEALVCESYLVELVRLMPRWGFEPEPPPPGRLADFWAALHVRLLAYAYNPRAARHLRRLRRARLWLSRRELVRRYGALAA